VVDCQLMRVRESNSKGNALCSPTLQNSHCTELCCQNKTLTLMQMSNSYSETGSQILTVTHSVKVATINGSSKGV
jgi:hypothetical protein